MRACIEMHACMFWCRYVCMRVIGFTESPEEFRAKLRNLVPELKANPSIYTEEVQLGGGKINRKVFVKGELKRDETLTIGSENDIIGSDGRPAKVRSIFFFFRMPWLSFASHLNPSPNFVFFSLFVPYRLTNPNKFIFIGEPSDFDSI